MDPNANLQQQLDLARLFLSESEKIDGNAVTEAKVLRLSELVLALDEWLSRGGFRPERWRNP